MFTCTGVGGGGVRCGVRVQFASRVVFLYCSFLFTGFGSSSGHVRFASGTISTGNRGAADLGVSTADFGGGVAGFPGSGAPIFFSGV